MGLSFELCGSLNVGYFVLGMGNGVLSLDVSYLVLSRTRYGSKLMIVPDELSLFRQTV